MTSDGQAAIIHYFCFPCVMMQVGLKRGCYWLPVLGETMVSLVPDHEPMHCVGTAIYSALSEATNAALLRTTQIGACAR